MQKTKVLIVEDEPIVMRVCDLILKINGFDPILASNGAEGLSTYNERHDEIHLVVSDVSMPEMSGIEMVRTLFETHFHPNVIMMSGLGLSDLVPEDLQKLCSVIGKLFTPRGLTEVVNNCLRDEENQCPQQHNKQFQIRSLFQFIVLRITQLMRVGYIGHAPNAFCKYRTDRAAAEALASHASCRSGGTVQGRSIKKEGHDR